MLGPLRDYCREGLAILTSSSLIPSGSADKVWDEFENNSLHWPAPWALVVLGHYVYKNKITG